MTKSISNGKYHLIANEESFLCLTSKLITWFIDSFISKNENPINCIFSKKNWSYIYSILDLEDQVHSQYGFYEQGDLQNYNDNIFHKSDEADNIFR
jgi:hypothetical protein